MLGSHVMLYVLSLSVGNWYLFSSVGHLDYIHSRVNF